FDAARRFDAHQPCGAQANMAKYLAAKASWEAANVCLQTHGGFGFAHEYDIERKFRETRLYQVAPISTNLIFSYVAQHIRSCRARFEQEQDNHESIAAAVRHDRDLTGTGHCRAVLHPPAGRSRRTRDQDRAPRCWRLRPRL